MNNIINILIAAQHDEDQDSIMKALLEHNDFFVSSIEKDESGTIIKAERLKPNVLILNLQLSEIDSLQLARIVRSRSPSTAIIMFIDKKISNHENDLCFLNPVELYACLAVKDGISSLLIKEEDIGKLSHVIRLVSSGGYYVSASITVNVFNAVTFINQFPGQLTKSKEIVFTPIERCIIVDMANGLSDKEIAKHLNFSTGTVRNCFSAIKRKVKIKNRVQIVIFSLIFGHVRLEQLDIYKNNRQFIRNTIQ